MSALPASYILCLPLSVSSAADKCSRLASSCRAPGAADAFQEAASDALLCHNLLFRVDVLHLPLAPAASQHCSQVLFEDIKVYISGICLKDS